MPDARVIPLTAAGQGAATAAAAGLPAAGPAPPDAATSDQASNLPAGARPSPGPASDPPPSDPPPSDAPAADPKASHPAATSPLRSVPDPPAGDMLPPAAEPAPASFARAVAPWPPGTAADNSALGFLRRRLTGHYPVDVFGFDAELTKSVLMAPMRPLYERYFRVETRGMEHVPDTGAALLVANHSGTLPLDAIMTQLALLDHHPASRHLRMLGADLVFRLPILASLARKGGVTLACNADAELLLSEGHLVGVWPEGFKGIGKPFSERYKLQRFGRGGFVAAAVRTGVPIIPCSIIGAEEIYPILGNANWLARLLGLPYVPLTPTFPWLGVLGLVPLPSKWIIEFGDPIDTAEYGAAAADDPMLVFNITDEVRESIQSTLYKLLMQRRSVFF